MNRQPVISAAEHDLVERAKGGCHESFRELWTIHQDRVFRLCYRMLNDRQAAEDATQEAFLKAFVKLAEFRADCSFSTWIYTIAVRAALMELRRQRINHASRHVSLDDAIADDSMNLYRVIGKIDRRQVLSVDIAKTLAAIDGLPEIVREVFLLAYIDGYEHSKIVEIVHTVNPRFTKGILKSRLAKARRLLRQRVGGVSRI
jgi:RNA polymerase sigma-70 factor (ECF subfamily)